MLAIFYAVKDMRGKEEREREVREKKRREKIFISLAITAFFVPNLALYFYVGSANVNDILKLSEVINFIYLGIFAVSFFFLALGTMSWSDRRRLERELLGK